MERISSIAEVLGEYASFVQLHSALREEAENIGRMAMYRPTKAHRTALERSCRGLYMPNDKKFYLLSGSYGSLTATWAPACGVHDRAQTRANSTPSSPTSTASPARNSPTSTTPSLLRRKEIAAFGEYQSKQGPRRI